MTKQRSLGLEAALAVVLLLMVFYFPASAIGPEFQITSPRPNSSVAEVVEVTGVGADPAGTVEVEVLTNQWWPQAGQVRINADGTWSYGPVYLSGQGRFNSHTVRAAVIVNGRRGKTTSVSGIVRK